MRLRTNVAVAVIAFVTTACSRGDPPPQSPAAAQAEWRVQCRPIRDARHQACYGPGRDAGAAAFDFYQVSVERKEGSDPTHVLFVKRLAIAQVNAGLLVEPTTAEVVRYDAPSRTVRFDVGREPIVYPMEAR